MSRHKEKESQIKLFSKRHRGGEYTCQVCFVVFRSIRGLRGHFERYQNPKHPCPECGTKFTKKQFLQSHIAFAHGAQSLKKYKVSCPVCNQNMLFEAALRSHICHLHSEWMETNLHKFVAKLFAAEAEYSSTIKNPEMTVRNRPMVVKFVKHIIRNMSDNEKEKASEKNGIRKNNSQKVGLSEASKAYPNDEVLKMRYNCKDCYVPLFRINLKKNVPMEVGTLEKKRKRSPEKRTFCRADECESPETTRPVKKRNEETQLRLLDIKVRLDKLPETGVFFNSKCNDYKNLEIAIPVTEALEECVDPLDLNESPTETTGTLGQYPTPVEFPVKIENSEPTSEIRQQFEEVLVGPIKVEPMHCDDSPERIEAVDTYPEFQEDPCRPESVQFQKVPDQPESVRFQEVPGQPESVQFPEVPGQPESVQFPEVPGQPESVQFQEVPGQPESVQYHYGATFGAFTDPSRECMDTFESVKVEIEEHPISELGPLIPEDHLECRSEVATVSPVVRDPKSPTMETDFSAMVTPQNTQVQESCTMVASKICNKLFTCRRTMLMHFRQKHLSCFEDVIYCVCGKKMIGRRAMERHFSRHCDRLVKTTRLSNENKSCKPLEKKYKCSKCGERFWLPTCLNDHPPNCELPKPRPVNPKNINRTNIGEYICRICDVSFASVDTLLQHLRSFSSERKWECAECGTEFTENRLLRNHIRSTHALKSTPIYTYFCEICNQGFTKKRNQRMHTMHIHLKEMMNRVVKAPTRHVSSTNNVEPVIPSMPENQCNVCNLVFVNRKRYMDHVSYYKQGDLHRCNNCGLEFDAQYKVHHHRKKVHYAGKIKNTYTHFCYFCKEGFTYKTHLHAHMFHVHDDEFNCITSVKDYNLPQENENSAEDLFPCKQCSNKFRTVSILLSHIKAHHGEGPKKINKVKCNHCDSHFGSLSKYITHLKYYHSNLPLPHINTLQGLQSTDNDSTAAALIDIDIDSSISDENGKRSGGVPNTGNPNAREIQPRKTDVQNSQKSQKEKAVIDRISPECYNCSICGANFSRRSELTRHRVLFRNYGPYGCELCGRSFNWQAHCHEHKCKHFRRDVHNNHFCPVCDEGFDTINDLNMHAIHLHREPLDDLNCDLVAKSSRVNNFRHDETNSNSFGDTPNSLNCPPACHLCNMVFLSEEMLNIHRENSHSLARENGSTSVESGVPSCLSTTIDGKSPRANDRFYVAPGEKNHSQAVDGIANRIGISNENIDLTRKFYRHDVPLLCGICNCPFRSKDLFFAHLEYIHEIKPLAFVFKSISDDGKQSLPTKVVKNSEGNYHVLGRKSDVKVRSAASPSVLQSGSEQLQTVELCGNMDTGNIRTLSITKEYYYRCRPCDIVFTNKKLIAVHNEKVHGVRTGHDELVNDATLRNLGKIREASKDVCDDNLWLGSKKDCHSAKPPLTSCSQSVSVMNPVMRNISSEKLVISDEEPEVSVEAIPTTANPPFGEDKRNSLTPPMRLITLPPGNYKISKLKVRSIDTGIVTKSGKNIK